MRIIRMAAAFAIAVTALPATVASADNLVEFSNETTQEHCSLVVQNCEVVLHSTADLGIDGHTFGFEIAVARCETELTAYLGESADGHIVNQLFTQDPPGNCSRRNCAGAEGEWPVQTEEAGPDELEMEMRFCIEPSGGGSQAHCTINLDVELIDHHSLGLVADNEPCHGSGDTSGEVSGEWAAESGDSDEIEAVHF